MFFHIPLTATLLFILQLELAKKLQSLARNGDSALMDAFQASFDGVAFNRETFDIKFFLDNAEAIANEK